MIGQFFELFFDIVIADILQKLHAFLQPVKKRRTARSCFPSQRVRFESLLEIVKIPRLSTLINRPESARFFLSPCRSNTGCRSLRANRAICDLRPPQLQPFARGKSTASRRSLEYINREKRVTPSRRFADFFQTGAKTRSELHRAD